MDRGIGVVGLVALALLALAGCAASTKPADEGPGLAKACTVRPCECVATDVPVFFLPERKPVSWKENGDATCPEGFGLVLKEQKP